MGRLSSVERARTCRRRRAAGVSRSYSSSEPSHHSTASGWRIAAQSSTQSCSFWLVGRCSHDPPSAMSWMWRVTRRSGRPLAGSARGRSPACPCRPPTPGAGCVARPSPSRSKITRWPWRSMPEHRALERVGGQVDLGQVGVTHHDPVAGPGVVRLDHALHRIGLPGSPSSAGGVPSPYRTVSTAAQSADTGVRRTLRTRQGRPAGRPRRCRGGRGRPRGHVVVSARPSGPCPP